MMRIDHVRAETRQARTTYRLTEEEIISALSDYVRGMRKGLPTGKASVWYDGKHYPSEWWASLTIDHTPPDCECSRCVVARVKGGTGTGQ